MYSLRVKFFENRLQTIFILQDSLSIPTKIMSVLIHLGKCFFNYYHYERKVALRPLHHDIYFSLYRYLELVSSQLNMFVR